ncbi:MAG: coiled-coil domain-containing protein [Pseudobdellovibrio sp.]
MFNALAYSKELEQAGFSRDQAEATINVFFKFMDYNFATKSDLSDAKSDLKADIAELRTELKTEITELRTDFTKLRFEFSSLENRMTIKFGLMQAATIGILAAVIKLL